MLVGDYFKRLKEDPTKTVETKVQQMLRITHVFSEGECKKLYSKPAALYRTAKIHKLKQDEGLDELSLRSVVSNIGKYSIVPN